MLEPTVFPWKSTDVNSNGEENHDIALIIKASRSLRVKIWTLYLTLLNDIVSLGVNEGRSTVGIRKWRELAASVQDGTIWDQVVKVGYSGVEANVDIEVIANL